MLDTDIASAKEEPTVDPSEIITLAMTLFQAAMNLHWEEVSRGLARSAELERLASASEDRSIRWPLTFLLAAGSYAQGQKHYHDGRPADAAAALELAHEMARRLVAERPAKMPESGISPFARSVELALLHARSRAAEESGDHGEARRLGAIARRLEREVAGASDAHPGMVAFKTGVDEYHLAINKLVRAMDASARMELDRARLLHDAALEHFERMETSWEGVTDDYVAIESVRVLAGGFRLAASAQAAYNEALVTAIEGDVSQAHVSALRTAEAQFHEAAHVIEGAAGTTQLTADVAQAGPQFREMALRTRNLAGLCAASLRPAATARSASPRVVFYFLTTFLVLLFALPLSGTVASVSTVFVFSVILTSLVVALIGAFGFESLRLLPWFDRLTGVFKLTRKEPSAAETGEEE